MSDQNKKCDFNVNRLKALKNLIENTENTYTRDLLIETYRELCAAYRCIIDLTDII